MIWRMVSQLPKNPPNNTAKTDTPSPKQRNLSRIQRNKTKFCDGYDSDGEDGPLVLERIMVKTVKEDEDIFPTLEPPPVAATVMLLDTTTDTTKTAPSDNDNSECGFVNIEIDDMITMKNSAL